MNKKALYSIISTFLFIIAIIIVVFGIVFYENIVLSIESSSIENKRSFQLSIDAREKIFHCFGNIIDTQLINESNCSVSLISKYRIERLNASGCSFFEYESNNISSDYTKKFSYKVPIKETNSSQVCLGILEVYN